MFPVKRRLSIQKIDEKIKYVIRINEERINQNERSLCSLWKKDESKIFGVFASFDVALKEFKKCVDEAREYFCWENTPIFMLFSSDKLGRAQEADLFSDYNLDVMPDEAYDEEEYTNDDPDIGWECCIGTDSASWIMTANLDDEYMIFPSLYIKKEKYCETETHQSVD